MIDSGFQWPSASRCLPPSWQKFPFSLPGEKDQDAMVKFRVPGTIPRGPAVFSLLSVLNSIRDCGHVHYDYSVHSVKYERGLDENRFRSCAYESFECELGCSSLF